MYNMAEMRATAAYNFIDLPDNILPSELEDYHDELLSGREDEAHAAFAEFLQTKGNLSGRLELNIETLTPLFIGGNEEKTFSPAGRVILPGSSLRGMVKNLMKIITCGSWQGDADVNDRHIYYRCLIATKTDYAWKQDLNNEYRRRMMNGRQHKAILGFLLKDKREKYFIAPLLPDYDYKTIPISDYEREFSPIPPRLQRNKDHFVTWHGTNGYIITGKQGKNKKYIRYLDLQEADWNSSHWFPVTNNVLNDYENDLTRRGTNLLDGNDSMKADDARALGVKIPADIESVIPCGYLEQHGKVTAFGHGLSFRIPYLHGIMDAIPKCLQKDTIDFATAMFGNKEHWAGRIFFEDAEPVQPASTLSTHTAHPLMSPNPTSYQLYLKQQGGKLNHWDSPGAEIRGYKMYWHNSHPDWQAGPDDTISEKNSCNITPIKKGSKFHAKVRFQNLSAVELGALLMIFDMAGSSDKIAYKLGQGKSLGLGSISIKSVLYLDDKKLYTNLFQEGQLAEDMAPTDGTKYLDAFTTYVKANGLERCWQETMSELSEMLDWQHATTTTDWSQRIRSMSGNVQSGDVNPRFKKRSILPTVHEVFQERKGGKS